MEFKPLLPMAVALTVGVTGCADLVSVLGLLGVSVTGQVRVPEHQLAALDGTGPYRTSAFFPGEVPVGAAAKVETYSLVGMPVAGSTARTDESGRFQLSGVPSDRVAVIRATVSGQGGRSLRLSGLVKATGGSTVMDLSAVSTIVAEGLLRKLGTSAIERMSQDQITALEHAVMGAGGTAGATVDLSGANGPASRFEAIRSSDAEVRDLVSAAEGAPATAGLGR